MKVLTALAGAGLMIVGGVWGLYGLLYFAEGVRDAFVTTTPADQAASSVGIFGGLLLFAMGAGMAWGGFRLTRGAPKTRAQSQGPKEWY